MSKKLYALFLVAFLSLNLVACSTPQEEKTPSPDEIGEDISDLATFKGIVKSIDKNANTAVINPNKTESAILASGDSVYIQLPDELELNIGDEVTVEYDGTIMEGNPLQINTISVNGIKN